MKYILATLSLILVINTATARNADSTKPVKRTMRSSIGLKAGENFEKMTGNNWEGKVLGSIVAGAVFELTKDRFGLQAELMYKTARFPFSSTSGNTHIKTEYCDFPVLLEYRLTRDFWVQGGVQFSGLISAKGSFNMNPGSDKLDFKRYFKQVDAGPTLGCEIRISSFVGGMRYIYGLVNNNNSSVTKISQNWQTRTFQVYLGYKFH
ncbi:MAG: hypothetical protein K0Q79_2414 [Flavipsychrobacter sp.]|jgi:hypothetical protein|nr:hypothetical protein [Flavipsychrobacter sp.]